MSQPMRIIIGSPATGDNFYPRNTVIQRLQKALETEHVLFLAPRRTGKTSAVLHLKERAPACCVFQNLERCNHPRLWVKAMADGLSEIQDERWLQWLKAAGDFLPRLNSEILELKETDWNQAADKLLKALGKLERPVWFLLDEFPSMVDLIAKKHGAAEAESTVHWLRCWLQENTQSPVRFLLTGSIGLDNVLRKHRIRGPGNDLNRQYLTPLDAEEGVALALRLADANDIPLNATLAREYVKRLGPAVWPYFIQLFLHELQDAAATPHQRCDLDGIYKAVTLGARNRYATNMWDRLRDIFEGPWLAAAKLVLKLAAATDLGVERSSLRAQISGLEDDDYAYVLEVLIHDGYLVEDGDRVWFFSHLLRDYWREKGRV